MNELSNITVNDIHIGLTATYTKTCTEEDLLLFATVSGDINPVHLDDNYAKTTTFGRRIAHGMYTGALVSAALATKLPGPGTIYLGQELKFKAPVFIDDTITVTLEVETLHPSKGIVGLLCRCSNQQGKIVATGKATVIAPKDKITLPAPTLPSVSIALT